MAAIQVEAVQMLICLETTVIWFKSMMYKKFLKSHSQLFYVSSVERKIVYFKMSFYVEDMERAGQ